MKQIHIPVSKALKRCLFNVTTSCNQLFLDPAEGFSISQPLDQVEKNEETRRFSIKISITRFGGANSDWSLSISCFRGTNNIVFSLMFPSFPPLVSRGQVSIAVPKDRFLHIPGPDFESFVFYGILMGRDLASFKSSRAFLLCFSLSWGITNMKTRDVSQLDKHTDHNDK